MATSSHYYAALDGAPDERTIRMIAQWMYTQVIRYDFAVPGVALLALAPGTSSREQRALMVAIKQYLTQYHYISTEQFLVFLAAGRANQHHSTKFHLDGAPDEAYLMLGYEPTEVRCELAIADYSRAAHELGLTPREFLQSFNPMYADHEQRLAPYVTHLDRFDTTRPHIALFNNSSLPYTTTGDNTLGVLHQATIATPHRGASRVLNSLLMGAVSDPAKEPVSPERLQQFLETDELTGTQM